MKDYQVSRCFDFEYSARLPMVAGFFLLGVLSSTARAATDCGKAKIVSGGEDCSSIQVEFDLSQCEDAPSKPILATPKCKEDSAFAKAKAGQFQYRANLKKFQGSLGNIVWDISGDVKQTPLTQKLKAAKESTAKHGVGRKLAFDIDTSATQPSTKAPEIPGPSPTTAPPPPGTPTEGVAAPAPATTPTPPASPAPPSPYALKLLDKDGRKVTFSGFVEMDTILDSTRSLSESPGNSPVDKETGTSANKANALNGRTYFSMRNTRIAFNVEAPSPDWKNRVYLEADFAGYDPTPPGPVGGSNSEASQLNNPTFRLRHAYLQSNNGGFQVLMGQTWELFGWQPYYFMATEQVSPVPAMLSIRTAQARLMQTFNLGESMTLQAALGLSRSPQRDSMVPGVEGGLRVSFPHWTSGFTGGASGTLKTQPASLAISGLARAIAIPTLGGGPADDTYYVGSGAALNAMIPLIPSSDGKQVGHTLSVVGEYVVGSGIGDQFAGWTGNMANPLESSTQVVGATTTAVRSKGLNLDAGIGDYDATNNTFHLVNLTSYNAHLQYHLPDGWNTYLNFGYGRLYSNNMAKLVPTGTLTSGGKVPYTTSEITFGNIVYCFTPKIRAGLEYARMDTTYADGNHGIDHRYQITMLFFF